MFFWLWLFPVPQPAALWDRDYWLLDAGCWMDVAGVRCWDEINFKLKWFKCCNLLDITNCYLITSELQFSVLPKYVLAFPRPKCGLSLELRVKTITAHTAAVKIIAQKIQGKTELMKITHTTRRTFIFVIFMFLFYLKILFMLWCYIYLVGTWVYNFFYKCVRFIIKNELINYS